MAVSGEGGGEGRRLTVKRFVILSTLGYREAICLS